MLAKESSSAAAAAAQFDLPQEVLEVLPADPFEQLDVARKITSIALSTRVATLESDAAALLSAVDDKDRLIASLQSQLQSLDASLSDAADKLAHAEAQRESLLKENASLSSTVRKLNRDVSKLEAFRKTLMKSLQEDEDSPVATGEHATNQSPTHTAAAPEDNATLPPSKSSSIQSHLSETGNSFAVDHDTEGTRPGISQNLLLASQTSTPRFTPPGSPPSLSATASPTKTSNRVSPRRRHSISFATTRGMSDDRSSIYSSLPSSVHNSISSSEIGSQTGRARVDGKEYFRQVRGRLSYEQFAAFLSNVKELNSHNQTREEALRKAEEIFGPDNKDLYAVFERLIARSAH